MSRILPKTKRSDILDYWPYFIFTILAVVYNFIFLRYGFNATDEGWLLSVAKRIIDGEKPYKDFYFLINPLTVYIQAALIKLMGDSHTVLLCRGYWAIQMWLMTIMASFLYRRYVRTYELFFLLLVSFTVSSMLISFPWYSYDAAFFALLAVVLFKYKRFLLMGLAVFLAFWSKQSYTIFLPLFFAGLIILKYIKVSHPGLDKKSIIKICVGLLVPIFVYMGYLLIYGTLGDYINNVFVLPPRCSNTSSLFAVFQNNHYALLIGLPSIVSLVVVFFVPAGKWLYLLFLTIPISLYLMISNIEWFSFSIIMLNYTAFLFLVLRLKFMKSSDSFSLPESFLPLLLLLIIIQFLSGVTFVGVMFGCLGAGLVLPYTYILIKRWVKLSGYTYFLPAIFIIVFVVAGYHKYNFVYRDDSRSNLTAEFRAGRLRGIKSTRRNVRQINALIDAVEKSSDRGDYILVYPDFPILYYLTDRKNPTPIDWYYWRGFNMEMLAWAMVAIERRPPQAVFIQAYAEDDYKRKSGLIPYNVIGPYRPMFCFIEENFKMASQVGDIFIYLPK